MQRDSDRQGEEDAWRAIVENYGDRVSLEDEQAAEPPTSAMAAAFETEPAEPQPTSRPGDLDEERFVPPPPPPLPAVSRDRLAAWVGLFGAPAVLLVCVVAGVALPPLLAYLLVAGFVGGFLYLVLTMQSGPPDPWDDGARL